MALNKVMLIGNVGKKPEIRYLDNQGASPAPKVATFPLATTERFRDRNGEVRENTEWHNIVAWRQLADLAEKFMDKGSQIYVEGRLRSRSWDGQDGQKRYITEVVADSIQLLGKKSDNPGAEGYQAAGAPSAAPAPAAAPGQSAPQAPKPVANVAVSPTPAVSGEEDDSDDLPF
ncbi:MAG: single-stranded DNA-binding protein [Bacteroidales bacterium]|nr:single-stranded DNA-binding protein [Bacteroidales bacterium]